MVVRASAGAVLVAGGIMDAHEAAAAAAVGAGGMYACVEVGRYCSLVADVTMPGMGGGKDVGWLALRIEGFTSTAGQLATATERCKKKKNTAIFIFTAATTAI